MPKTKTFAPTFRQLAGSDGVFLPIIVAPIDEDGIQRGGSFTLRVKLDGSEIIGPDDAVVITPVPDAILNASVATGSAPIQAEIDALDAANVLDAYY
jgi:hypothetical protein